MNNKQKKALYESIMKSVAKTVKSKLNENLGNSHDTSEVEVIMVSIINDNQIDPGYTKIFTDNELAESYFCDTFRDFAEYNIAEDEIEESLEYALEEGYYNFADEHAIAINEITFVK